jgi:DNA-binding NtrC family response regulator
VLVFLDNAEPLLASRFLGDRRAFDMAGPFHDGALLARLKEAAASRRPPLLAGPSGVGKELAAAALARFWGLHAPLRYNASASAGPEEMSRALFGVAHGAFTGVEKRDGLIVSASRAGQPLFLDEVHHLPLEAQATLLTVIEDGKFARKGAEDKELEVDVRFVFASNEPDRLKPDLRARLWSVDVPPLRDRAADVPALFDALLARCLGSHGAKADAVLPALDGDLYCDLCLAAVGGRFEATNVRGLLDVADRIAARVATGADPGDAVDSVLGELGLWSEAGADADGAGGQYDAHRELIEAVYRGCGRNAKKTVELIKASGVPWTISRRHLSKHLARWGFKEE